MSTLPATNPPTSSPPENAASEATIPIDTLCINTIRTLAMDAVQAANSGHPGTPMAMAPVAYNLWQRHLRYDPLDPIWPNRDRFVLSIGHASMLLYSLLHLYGVRAVGADYQRLGSLSVSLDDIKRFRQLGSRCPGHPEYRFTSGVETTTGPLGQGVATSVGMAIASRWLGSHYNRPDFDLFGYRVYALCGDGDMMEGVSSEAASLAAHLKLSNLCWIYDSNRITIEGSTQLAFSEDVAGRFLAYGWNVVSVGDANDLELLDRAFHTFHTTSDRPTLIIVHSHIAWGAPHKQDTHGAHGEPLGEEEIRLTKRNYHWPEEAKFYIPDGVREHMASGLAARGQAEREQWQALFDRYRQAHPQLASELDQQQRRQLPEGWDLDIPTFAADPKGISGRDASGKVENAIAQRVPWLLGGAADLAPSTKTRLTFASAGDFSGPSPGGRNFHFGIREHAMAAILNGLSLSKLRPFGSGFLIFSDYARPAIRLSALMELPTIHVFTHDSIGVGEDGPTHQPIEQLPSLRSLPGLYTIRPGDANEVAAAWRLIMQLRHVPVALVLSRQAMPVLDRQRFAAATGLARGGYVLGESTPTAGRTQPQLILIASGSELGLAVDAFHQLDAAGIATRVVSLPCWELFEQQSAEYQDSVLPAAVPTRISIEQAATFGWSRYVGSAGHSIGMHSFGASAPLKDLQKRFGFTVADVVAAAHKLLGAASPAT